MTRRPPGPLAWAVALAVASLAAPAGAVVPSGARVTRAVAETNAKDERTRPLEVQLTVLSAANQTVAEGRARLDPSGDARLELVAPDGTRETHERIGAVYRARREDREVERPLRLLPPARLLQLANGRSVASALRLIGADPSLVELGFEGESDCWVVGGRDRGTFSSRRTSLWVDTRTHEPVRIDEGGVQYRLGPPAQHDGIRFPSWVEVETPGAPVWRLEIRSVRAAR